jgi:hypothetical protein
MTYTTEQLLEMTAEQLGDVFRDSPPGNIPNGKAKGTAIIKPGTDLAPVLAEIVEVFAWQGKTFDATSDTLVNEITFFGISAIKAKIYVGPSLSDTNECIILDYSANSGIVGKVRDEIRLISPQLYLGLVYLKEDPTIYFALEFDELAE